MSTASGVSNAEFFLIVLFTLYVFFGGKVSISKIDIYFVLIVFWYYLGGLIFDRVSEPGFYYQLKNFIGFFIVFYLSRNIVKTEQDLYFLFNSIILGVVGLTISVFINGFNNIGVSSFAGQRDIFIASGFTWNGYVGLLSLVFTVVLHLFIVNFNLNSKRYYYTYFILMLSVVFIVVLSSGRQAISTISIVVMLSIFMYLRGVGRVLGVLYFSLFLLFLYISYFIISVYFQDFYSFSTYKYDTYMDDLIYVRLYTGFLEPLINFDFGQMMIFGDPSLNKHNIFTTILYKFGFVGFFIYFGRFVHLTIYIYYRSRVSKLQNIYNFKKLYILVLVSFFLTNFVANIWYQSYLYGYIFWIFIGAIFGVVKFNSTVSKVRGI